MRILQFAFQADARTASCRTTTSPTTVVYTGTHDNDTVAGWFATAPESEKSRAVDVLGHGPETISWKMIRAAYGSVADDAIVPLQDLLGLGSEARFNTPAEAEGNWGWRFLPEQVPKELPARLRRLGEVTDRMPLLKSPAAAAGS